MTVLPSRWAWRGADRLLLGDIYGKLFEVNLRRGEDGVISGMSAQDVGDVSLPRREAELS